MHFSVRLSVGPYSVFVSLVVIPKASASGHKNQRVVLAKFPNDHNSYDRVNRHGADEGTDILTWVPVPLQSTDLVRSDTGSAD